MKAGEKALGAIYGHLAGDALGVPYEFKLPGDLPMEITWTHGGTHGQPAGTYSDDGALMLCTLASLVENGGFDATDMGRRFVAWMDRGYMAAGGRVFDYGHSTLKAISRLREGVDALCAGQDGEADNGNGSLMRLVPISLWTSTYPKEQQVSISHDCSKITHAHPRSQVCCALYSLMVRYLLRQARPETAWENAASELKRIYTMGNRWPVAFATELDLVSSCTSASGSGYVVDSLRSSVLSLFGGDDYASVARAAVRFGNDTDSTACIAGGLAGVIYGVGSIPREWREGLRLEQWQTDLIDRFASGCKLPDD